MLKSLTLLSLAATISLANAQSADLSASPQQPAPIVRSYQQQQAPPQQAQLVDTQPISGVWLRSDSNSALTTLSATAEHTEIRLDRGCLNITINQPAQQSEILIDLPGGQTSLLKDGLYTFNADTNTVRVLRGEAATYPGPIATNADTKPIRIKEDHQLSLATADAANPGDLRPVESHPDELTADLLPLGNPAGAPASDRAYADGGYSGGYYGGYAPAYPYPYYAGLWGYPGFYPGYFGYGYPYGYGLGLGFGYGFGGYGYGGYGYRGFGGYRGGYGGGFHGGYGGSGGGGFHGGGAGGGFHGGGGGGGFHGGGGGGGSHR